MSNLIEIKEYEVLVGTSIEDACNECLSMAKENHCIVKTSFNDISLRIYWFETKEEIYNEYIKKFKEK